MMKKYIVSSLLVFGVFCIYVSIGILLGACDPDYINPDGTISPFKLFRSGEKEGIEVKLDTKAQSVNSNSTKAGESFPSDGNFKVYEFAMDTVFKKQYGLDPASIASFYVDSVEVKWNQNNICSKLESYTVKIEYPDFVAIANGESKVIYKAIQQDNTQLGCSSDVIMAFKDIDFQPEVTEANLANTTPQFSSDLKAFQYEMLTSNFAKAIQQNQKIKISFKMKAKEALDANSGITIAIRSRMTYKKKVRKDFTLKATQLLNIQAGTSPKFNFVFDTKPISDQIDINNIASAEIDHFVITNDNEKLPITGRVEIFEPVDFYTCGRVPDKPEDYKNFIKFGFYSRTVKPDRTNIRQIIKDKGQIKGELKNLENFDSKSLVVNFLANITLTLYE